MLTRHVSHVSSVVLAPAGVIPALNTSGIGRFPLSQVVLDWLPDNNALLYDSEQ